LQNYLAITTEISSFCAAEVTRGGEMICPHRWLFDPKIAADLCPFAEGSAVRTFLVAGSGEAAGSQRAYSLGSCTVGQTDRRIAIFQKAPPPPPGEGIIICTD